MDFNGYKTIFIDFDFLAIFKGIIIQIHKVNERFITKLELSFEPIHELQLVYIHQICIWNELSIWNMNEFNFIMIQFNGAWCEIDMELWPIKCFDQVD